MTTRLRRASCCLAVCVVVAGVRLPAASGPQETSTKAALASFQKGVNDYMSLRWRATRDLPLLWSGETFRDMMAILEQHVRAVRWVRYDARPGNVFGQSAVVLRQIIADTLLEYGIDPKELVGRSAVPKRVAPPQVNDRFPWLSTAILPVDLIMALPPLPVELQYRLCGRDIVLLDMDLELVVDVLPDALPKN